MKKNLFIRKHIQEIIYSKENIRINFIYSDSGVSSDDSHRKKFSEDLRGGAEESKARRAEISDTKSGINNYCGLTSGNDLLKMAGEAGFEPANAASKGRCLAVWRLPIKPKRLQCVF